MAALMIHTRSAFTSDLYFEQQATGDAHLSQHAPDKPNACSVRLELPSALVFYLYHETNPGLSN